MILAVYRDEVLWSGCRGRCRNEARSTDTIVPWERPEINYARMTYLSCNYDGMALRLGSITLGSKGVWAGLNGQSRGARSELI